MRLAPDLDILRLLGSSMAEQRLGDIIDDHCIKCRRITNHSIVSLMNGEAAKVRCRTCYHDHDYRHEQAPPSKKELKKAEAEAAMAAGNGNLSVESRICFEAHAIRPTPVRISAIASERGYLDVDSFR